MRDPGLRGILRLLARNRDYRRVWLAQAISQAGDWVGHVAVATLLLDLTGLGTVVAYSLILRMLPWVFVSPLAGVLIDRWNRKSILVATDVARGLLVPLLLLADSAERVWLVYAVVAVQVSLSAFFEPARQSVVPAIVSKQELLSANALSSVTWSLMLSVGSALGGLLIAAFGLGFAFLVDASTYLVSAAFLLGVRVPRREERGLRSVGDVFRDLGDGFRYMRSDRSVFSLVFVKMGVGLAGGMVLLLTVLGERVYAVDLQAGAREGTAALGIGILFAARGLGTALGPFVGRAISGYDEPSMRRLIGFGFLQAAIFFFAFGFLDRLTVAAAVLMAAHVGTSIAWVFSTVLLQLNVPDEFRGRVFSAELLLFTLVFCAATYATAYALDHQQVDPRALASGCGVALLLPAAVWLLALKGKAPPVEPK